MTKMHGTLEKTVKREGLQTLGHWLDHHGAEQSLGKVNVCKYSIDSYSTSRAS